MSSQSPTVSDPGTAASAPAESCLNCGAALVGRFCHKCGQKRIEPEERRFGWFVAQAVREVTMLEGRTLRSVGRLAFRPGSLDRDWLAGRRRVNVAPLSLFLLANLIYFFHPPLSDLNLSLAEQMGQVHEGVAWPLVSARLEARGISFTEYAALYNQQAASLAKLMVILHVPALAAVLMALHFRRRLFYVDHVAVALHSWAFILLHGMATPFLLTLVVRATGVGSPAAFQLSMAVIVIVFFWQQLRVAYGQPGWLAAAKLPLLLVGFAASHFLFRFVQFLVVFATS